VRDEKRENAASQQCDYYSSAWPIIQRQQAISPHHKLGHQRNGELLRMRNDTPEQDGASVIALKWTFYKIVAQLVLLCNVD